MIVHVEPWQIIQTPIMFMNKSKATFQATCYIAFSYNEVLIIDNL
jgi:hypothetical protein